MEQAELSPDEMHRLVDLRRRAERRTTKVIAISFAVMVVTIVASGFIGRHRHPDRHDSVARLIIVTVVLLVIMSAIVVAGRSAARRRPDSVFAPLSVAGLKRSDRRLVMRAVRSGTPSHDAVFREAEREVAARLNRNPRFNKIAPFLVVLYAVSAIAADTARGRVLGVILTAMWVAIIWYQRLMRRRASRYLTALGALYGSSFAAAAEPASERTAAAQKWARWIPIWIWVGAWALMFIVHSVVDSGDSDSNSVVLACFVVALIAGSIAVVVLAALGSRWLRRASLTAAPIGVVTCVLDAFYEKDETALGVSGALAFAAVLIVTVVRPDVFAGRRSVVEQTKT